MDDPRLLEWLWATEEVAEAGDTPPAESMARLEAVRLRRAELQHSLECDPPKMPPSALLSRRLRDAEERLRSRASTLERELARLLDCVREQQQATSGYRPVSHRRPSFVSHDV